MNKEIQSRFLEHSDPNVVYDWFEKNTYELWRIFDKNPKVELILLKRNEPIIDLALALFSKNSEIRNILFDRGDSAIQKAVLTNKNCNYFPELENLLKEEKTEYLEILLTNTEDRLLLVQLFERGGVFGKIKKEYWLTLLEITIKNKILKYSYSDNPEWDDDPFGMGLAARLYQAVYGLFNILNVTDENAGLLANFVQKLPSVSSNFHFDLNASKMISKWKNKKSIQHADYLYFYENKNNWDPYYDKRFTKISGKCRVEQNYVICRTHLANFFPDFKDEFKKFEASDDIALRMAYYRNENWNWEEKVKKLSENWNKYQKVDGNLFIKNIIKNISIYWNKEIRVFFDVNVYFVDEYQERLKEFKHSNPEEFINNEQIEKIDRIVSECTLLKNDLNSISHITRKIEKYISSQKVTSFLIVFLLVVLVLILWL